MALFIAFEGIDGSGTSTQAKMLLDHFTAAGRTALLTSEPSSGPIGSLIRLALANKVSFFSHPSLLDAQMAFLFAADRFDHVYNEQHGVLANLHRGIDVICVRYFPSSFAYHGDDEVALDRVERLNREFPKPDLLVYLDVPVRVSMERIAARGKTEVYETEEKLARVRENYRAFLLKYDGRHACIDGTLPPEIVHREVLQFVENRGPNEDD